MNQRGPAFNWLQNANLNHPRREEIAKQLEVMVDENRQGPFGNQNFFNVYFRWATMENVPSLIRLVEVDQFQHRRRAMQALAKLKDPRGVEPLAKRLENFFDRQAAAEALTEIGPIAESAVLKYFNHPDRGLRDLVRRMIQGYDTKPDVLLGQCLIDLDAPTSIAAMGRCNGLP